MNDVTQPGGNQPLPVGHTLLWYTLEQVLGHGGFGTTYLAVDTNLNRKVAIKEYLPSIFAFRDSDYIVQPLTADHKENYDWGLNSFLNEARTLAQFKHRNVVQVQTVFEEYNTAYMVMEYEQGDPLDNLFKTKGDTLNQPFFENLLFLVMDGLQSIHDAGFIHRDIKPGNLYIRSDGSPVLIDFGSARQTSQQKTTEMTTLVSQGYTPLEQYSANFGEQGPWTDIYSLAASVYHGVVGSRPEDALNRSASLLSSKPDPLPSLATQELTGYSRNFCEAIDVALALKPAERPQSLAAWKVAFQEQASPSPTMAQSEFDDDATRMLPAGGVAFANTQALDANTFDEFTQQQSQTHNTEVDPLDWDEPPAHTQTTHRPQERESVTTAAKNQTTSSSIPLIAGGGLLVLALAAGGWWMANRSSSEDTVIIEAELMDTLPAPDQTEALPVPETIIATEISELRALSALYQNLLEADPESSQGKEGIAFVVENYRSMSQLNAVKYNASLRSKLTDALRTITFNTDSNGQAEQLIGDIDSMGKITQFTEIQATFDNPNRSPEDNDHIIFALASLSPAEKSVAMADKRVVNLTAQFKASIVDSIKSKEFERARHMTSLVLLINPDDPELVLLKEHLERN